MISNSQSPIPTQNSVPSQFEAAPRHGDDHSGENLFTDFFLTLVAILLGLTVFAATSQGATAPQVSGRIFTNLYTPSENADREAYRQAATSLWLDIGSKLNDQSQVLVGLEHLNLDQSTTGSSSTSTRLREGYFLYNKDGWEIRGGKQIIPWGKSDAVNPTDLLTAKNYTVLNPDEEVRRTGATALTLAWTPSEGASPWTLQGVFIPIFAQSQLLINPNSLPSSLTGANSSPSTLAKGLSTSESAIKLSYMGTGWDFSLLYFNGFNHMPEYQVSSITVGPPTSVAVVPTFHRQQAVGADWSFTSGDWIYRGEIARISTENPEGTNPLIQPTHLDAVLGIEKSFWEDYRVQLQALIRHHDKFTAPGDMTDSSPVNQAVYRQVAALNALLLNYQDKTRTGATFRFSYGNDQKPWEYEVFVLGNFVGHDSLVKPKITYKWTDALRTTLGADSYNGPTDRPLGAMKAYNSVFFEGKYTF